MIFEMEREQNKNPFADLDGYLEPDEKREYLEYQKQVLSEIAEEISDMEGVPGYKGTYFESGSQCRGRLPGRSKEKIFITNLQTKKSVYIADWGEVRGDIDIWAEDSNVRETSTPGTDITQEFLGRLKREVDNKRKKKKSK